MKILILSSNNTAGAGRAADRLHKAFLSEGINSHLWLNNGVLSTATTVVSRGFHKYFRSSLSVASSHLLKLQRSEIIYPRSLGLFRNRLVDKINASDFDVVNLHWFNGEMLSIRDISRIRKPIVMTLHDMWAFCGAEHYSPDRSDARWRNGYTRQNRLSSDSGLDLDRWTWNRKRCLWKNPFQLVCPSNWLADCVKCSALMADWPVSVIPNPIEFNIYKPWPKDLAREMVGLPSGAKIILFGALGNDKSGRKGQDLLLDALAYLRSGNGLDYHLAIFGQSKLTKETISNLPIHCMGHKHDDISMALLYSAADVMVVPSRMHLCQLANHAVLHSLKPRHPL
jgi:glycosyltransferase involved in cell wall biosynthesis